MKTITGFPVWERPIFSAVVTLLLFFQGCTGESKLEKKGVLAEVPAEALVAGHSAPNSIRPAPTRQAHVDSLKKIADLFGRHEVGKTGLPVSLPGHFGIDVSHYQGVVDWDKVDADTVPYPISFVVVKATQGKDMVDGKYRHNWQEAKKRGFRVGAYHFYVFKDDPVEQARNYIKNVSLSDGDLMPIVDVEFNCASCTTPGIPEAQLVADLKKYIAEIKNHFGKEPLIYSFEGFYTPYLKKEFSDYLYWMAWYPNKPSRELEAQIDPDNPAKPQVVCWQFMPTGHVPGISAEVDMSFLPGRLENRMIYRE
jgi:GH25 family lysozyme M1 (1,4-beta-N-acetylmuramidase)